MCSGDAREHFLRRYDTDSVHYPRPCGYHVSFVSDGSEENAREGALERALKRAIEMDLAIALEIALEMDLEIALMIRT